MGQRWQCRAADQSPAKRVPQHAWLCHCVTLDALLKLARTMRRAACRPSARSSGHRRRLLRLSMWRRGTICRCAVAAGVRSWKTTSLSVCTGRQVQVHIVELAERIPTLRSQPAPSCTGCLAKPDRRFMPSRLRAGQTAKRQRDGRCSPDAQPSPDRSSHKQCCRKGILARNRRAAAARLCLPHYCQDGPQRRRRPNAALHPPQRRSGRRSPLSHLAVRGYSIRHAWAMPARCSKFPYALLDARPSGWLE